MIDWLLISNEATAVDAMTFRRVDRRDSDNRFGCGSGEVVTVLVLQFVAGFAANSAGNQLAALWTSLGFLGELGFGTRTINHESGLLSS